MSHVLVVDDRADDRALVSTVLRHAGHTIVEAADGEQALGLVRAERPDLVVSDILMPAMDGYELVRRLRADPALRQPPVVFVTANYLADEARDLARACGVVGVVEKPAEPARILAAAEDALRTELPPAPAPSDELHHEHLRLVSHKLLQKIAELERAQSEVRELNAELQQAQRLESVGQLAGGIAHDFNNLLAVIINYASFAADELPEGSIRDDVEEIRRAAERAAELTRQLLIFSRREVVSPELLALGDVVGDVEKLLRRTIGEHIDLRVATADGLWPVNWDPRQIEQVLMNLAVNARDAMPEGGRLAIELSNVELDEAYARTYPDAAPGRHVLLAVADGGCGMEPEVVSRAFEPFFTTKPKDQGTGLGLATVYGIARQAGGHARLRSEPGRGTVVSVYLPAAEAGAAPAREQEAAAAAPLDGHGETVLVVEDEDGVRGLTCRILAAHGYSVLEARGPGEALELCGRHGGGIDLLLTDVVLPELGGVELAKRLAEPCPGLRVLYMSGYTDDTEARGDASDGGAGFLEKPFDSDSLLRAVRAAL